MFQQTIILGRLTKDPELRYLQNGTPICKFTVVTSRNYFDSESQEWKEQPEFHVVSAFNKIAKSIGEICKKGHLVHIIGRNKTSKFEKDGQTHWSTEVRVDEIKFLTPKGSGKPSGESSPEPAGDSPAPKPKAQPKPKSQPKQQRQEAPEPDYSDYSDVPPSDNPSDDIPF